MDDQKFFESLRDMAGEGLKLWESPSVCVGVVKDGKTVFCGGFGLRDVEKNLPADGETLYQIGSCSKAFTAALVAILVDQGKLDWDAPVTTYVPEVRFYDDFTTEAVTLRDLLCHRTGLPRHEYSWYGTDFDKATLVHNLRYLEPNQPIRTKFQYNNQCFILAGYVVERVTGKSFEECLDEYLFGPLGMNRSCAFVDDIEGNENHAEPYDRTNPDDALHGMKKIPFYRMPKEDKSKGIGAPLGPAGSINSCAGDMLKWVTLHLNEGEFEGKRIVSKEAMQQMHKPQMLLTAPLDMPMDETEFWCYGLGWFVESFRGHKIVHHGGNINGFSGFTCFVPDLNLGVVAYTNMNSSFLHYALAREIIDHYLGAEGGNWVKRYHDFVAERLGGHEKILHAMTGDKVEGTQPSHPLEDYVGVYGRPGYTDVTITLENGALRLSFIGTEVELAHFHYDTFLLSGVMGELPSGIPVHFYAEEAGGRIGALSMPLVTEPGGKLIRFDRK